MPKHFVAAWHYAVKILEQLWYVPKFHRISKIRENRKGIKEKGKQREKQKKNGAGTT